MPASSRSTPDAGPAAAVEGARKRTADVRAALVDAAWWVLEHDGLAGLTVRAVATRADVAPMGVYNHLRDKDGLVTAVLIRAFDELSAALAYPAHLPPAEALLAEGRAYRTFAHAHPVPYSLLFGSGRTVEHLAADHPDALALATAGASAFAQLVVAIRAGQAAGVVRDGTPEQIAFGVWSAVHGAVSLESVARPDPAVGDDTYEQVLQMVLRGIAP